MILSLRTAASDTIVHCEVWETNTGEDISVTIDIKYYSLLLLKYRDHPFLTLLRLMTDFDKLQDLREEWFEYKWGQMPIKEFARARLKEVMDKYPELYYVED